SNATATLLASMLFVGIALACPLAGWLYPYIRSQLRPIFFCAALLMCATLSWVIYWPPTSLWMYGAVMIFLGGFSCVYVMSYTYVKEIVDESISTTAIGFTNALCVATVPVLQPLIGYLLQFSHNRNSVGADDVYNLVDYQFALAVLPISLLIAAALSWFIFRVPGEVTEKVLGSPQTNE
ncbi:MAG: hypothetical protein M3R00_07135, partial [Pseudomonadota bacterium]|nr:hypothetical protein [Pseudomonadota bacterium]